MMYDMVELCCVLLMYLLAMVSVTTEGSVCVYDQLSRSLTPRSTVIYSARSSGNRDKRDTADLYRPIRIKVDYHDLGEELTSREQARLKEVISDTLSKVEQIFKVVPVRDHLLLGRSFADACGIKIISGPNAGKCSSMRGSYSGEYCLDEFKVPDYHLEGFNLYNSNSSEPVLEVYGPGTGVPDVDYILYVRSLTSRTCITQGLSTIAYATYCQVDQNDRPVAGFINFCPVYLKDRSYNRDKASVTGLHEVFHALGFASELFPKFKECHRSGSGVSCTNRWRPIRELYGVQRLVTPKVVNVTSEHFQCRSHITENEFGPVLQTENGKIMSHWDTAFMYGSLMAATIGQPHLTFLDEMTLAAFEDSGWYKVNYDFADTYLWGKDGGCQFGLSGSCDEPGSPYYCTGSVRGCHYLHYDKAVCETDRFLHGCNVYKAKTGYNCMESENSPPAEELHYTGEIYTENSRCFMGNLTRASESDLSITTVPVGRCYQVECRNNSLYVRADGGAYHACPSHHNIQLPGYTGVVTCPEVSIVCRKETERFTTTPQPIAEPTPRHRTTDSMGRVCIDLHYAAASYSLVYLHSRQFLSCNLDVILACTGISRRRLEKYFVRKDETDRAVFRFDLLPARYSDDGPVSSVAITILRNAINNGNFTFVIPPSGPKYMATSLMVMRGQPVISPKEMPIEVIAGAVVGGILGAVLIGILVYITQRYYTTHSRPDNDAAVRPSGQRDNRQLSDEISGEDSARNNSRSHAENPRSRESRSEQRRDSARSQSRSQHARQSPQSRPFRSPPSAHTLTILADSTVEMSPRQPSRHYAKELMQGAVNSHRENSGHINLTFDPSESPNRSRSKSRSRSHSRSPERSHDLENHVINIGTM